MSPRPQFPNEKEEEFGEEKNGIAAIVPEIMAVILLVAIGAFIGIVLPGSERDEVEQAQKPQDASQSEGRSMSEQEIINNGVRDHDTDESLLGVTVDKHIGTYFRHPETDKTLYVRKEGRCTGDCLDTWTPYLAEEAKTVGNLSTTPRADSGELQYVWAGKPLYTFERDEELGDVLGSGHDQVWQIARP